MRKEDEYMKLLEDTINFYSKKGNNRAVVGERCRYLTDDGYKCAVGRFIREECYNPSIEGSDALCLLGDGDEILVDSHRGFDPNFWGDLQILHDMKHNWEEDPFNKGAMRLTEEGKEAAMDIRIKIESMKYEME
tara:strand:+ start:847 stop:1248 length:402 start_codon:yes stop_codon:yes gene_type:complete